ncbi:hypothetical protein OSB04_027474 [Centaurea solstitialis]|uniref:Uncharacterized protein n=1 Tax=Centaurea solstitialis TaxID=347529 RepID=A0AA38SYW3_9ASTR|nr:hypothetical protein OSB04_027474 [Centaurea solstitialis]
MRSILSHSSRQIASDTLPKKVWSEFSPAMKVWSEFSPSKLSSLRNARWHTLVYTKRKTHKDYLHQNVSNFILIPIVCIQLRNVLLVRLGSPWAKAASTSDLLTIPFGLHYIIHLGFCLDYILDKLRAYEINHGHKMLALGFELKINEMLPAPVGRVSSGLARQLQKHPAGRLRPFNTRRSRVETASPTHNLPDSLSPSSLNAYVRDEQADMKAMLKALGVKSDNTGFENWRYQFRMNKYHISF